MRGVAGKLTVLAALAALTAATAATTTSAAQTDPADAGQLRRACALATAVPSYLLPSQADLVALLPPPPAQDSAAEQLELAAVLAAQRDARARGLTARAIADATSSCGRFEDVLGAQFIAQRDAAVIAFLDRAAHEASRFLDPVKDYWKRIRPFAVSGSVQRLGDMAPDWKGPRALGRSDVAQADCAADQAGAQPPGREPRQPRTQRGRALIAQQQADEHKKELELEQSSYPSGHAAYGTVCAILLADMVPEKRTQLFARADDFSHSRLVLGAHFPSDLAAGRIGGTVAVTLMMQNARFQHDYAEARTALRSTLGLPADVAADPWRPATHPTQR